jgi:aspartyl-tRNA(Asn)/glutamyl-tRNA(Gln) amidotransferase subunit B
MILEVVKDNKDPQQLANDKKVLQVSDESELVMIIEQVLGENQKASQDVKNGELKAIGFLVGQVMKASQGRANPAVVQELIKKQLGV